MFVKGRKETVLSPTRIVTWESGQGYTISFCSMWLNVHEELSKDVRVSSRNSISICACLHLCQPHPGESVINENLMREGCQERDMPGLACKMPRCAGRCQGWQIKCQGWPVGCQPVGMGYKRERGPGDSAVSRTQSP